MFNGKYKMTKVKPKHGLPKDVHNNVLGKVCEIVDADVGFPAIIKYYKDEESFSLIYTSRVVDVNVTHFVPTTMVVIETKNTVYVLEKI